MTANPTGPSSGSVRRFRNILFVPAARRGNTAALRRVVELARRDDASITVLGVIAEPPLLQRLLHGSDHAAGVLATLHREMRRRLDRCVAPIDVDGIEPTTIIDVGHPVLSVISRLVAARHDLLVVTSDRESDDRAMIKRFIRKSPCPVWMIRPSRAEHERVLASIDPEHDQDGLNASILQTARAMAGGEPLHVVSSWELYGESTMQSSAFAHVDPLEIERRRDAVHVAHEQAVDALVHRFLGDPDDVDVHVLPGSPTTVIPDVIRRERINLVVMGTYGRSGISGFVMGNTAEVLLETLTCSVMAIKPPESATPIPT